MILPIAIVEMIVINFRFFFKIAANAEQKYESEISISVKHISVCFAPISRIITGQSSSQDGHYG